ncbi:MAG: hypothetical protein U0936_07285 [Planctomycetaceae bacterium]
MIFLLVFAPVISGSPEHRNFKKCQRVPAIRLLKKLELVSLGPAYILPTILDLALVVYVLYLFRVILVA